MLGRHKPGQPGGAATGAVRARPTRICAKAGVSGRARFAALFFEDQLVGGVPDTARVAGRVAS